MFHPSWGVGAEDGTFARPAFEPLRYEIANSSGETSFVTVRFSMLPVMRWHHLDNAEKRPAGIVGHGGVSILRAGREIANGWYLMGGKRRENYDDWWRCEIEFDPAFDEPFGITINKQGVRPTIALREAMEPELESIARLLNNRVRQAFEEVKFEAAVQGACRIASDADADLPITELTSCLRFGGSSRFDSRHGRKSRFGPRLNWHDEPFARRLPQPRPMVTLPSVFLT